MLAVLEGISYLMLIPTIILKYKFDMGFPNKIVGSLHGLLFIMCCLWVVYFAMKAKWKFGKTIICLLASLLPFATFLVDSHILKREPELNKLS